MTKFYVVLALAAFVCMAKVKADDGTALPVDASNPGNDASTPATLNGADQPADGSHFQSFSSSSHSSEQVVDGKVVSKESGGRVTSNIDGKVHDKVFGN